MTQAGATPLRTYYDALGTLKEYEQTALAEAHALDPELLLRRFQQSLDAFDSPISEPFYDTTRTDPADRRGPADQIASTIQFAAQISDGARQRVEGAESLAFRYVDRELSPLRTRGQVREARRSLDLLLVNADDGLPIFAELKIASDKPSYYALVQLLALAADLLPASQRNRLQHHGSSLVMPDAGPFADLYIITFKPPTTGDFRKRSFDATRQISEQLLADGRISAYVRRIAYLQAAASSETLKFDTRFAYGTGF